MTESDPITRLNAALEGRDRVERGLGEGGWELKAQIPWLRVFVEGVVIVGGGCCDEVRDRE